MMRTRHQPTLLAAAVFILLAGCGGGTDTADTEAPTSAPAPTAPAAPAAAAETEAAPPHSPKRPGEPPAAATQPPDAATAAGSERRVVGTTRLGPPAETKPGAEAFVETKARARRWLDRVQVDPAELRGRGYDGIKRLAEILEVYCVLYRSSDDEAQREAILQRAAAIAEATADGSYHALRNYSDEEFDRNSMSYLRVALLMEQLGLDTQEYRRQIAAIKPNLDGRMTERGAWQREMFAKYYLQFGLVRPALLLETYGAQGVLALRVPYEEYRLETTYELIHWIFLAYDYGLARDQGGFSTSDRYYLAQVLPPLVEEYVRAQNPDVVGELLSCLNYLGWGDTPAAHRAAAYLLAAQNEDGNWGDYELMRIKYGRFVDQELYLHTTLVALRGLVDHFEAKWGLAADGPGSGDSK